MNPAATLHEHHRQHGLSLIELMISLTIGLVLLMGITTLIVQQSSTRDELEKSSRQIENGRYATQILHTDLQQAGFYGLYSLIPAYGLSLGLAFPPAAPLPDPCLITVADLSAALPLPIQGYNNALPAANFSCALDGVSAANNALNYQPGTDILVIRRTDNSSRVIFNSATPPVTTTNLTTGQVYLQTNAGKAVMGIGAGAPGDIVTYPLTFSTKSTSTIIYSPLRKYFVHIYFISPCSKPANGSTSCTGTADDNGHPIPTLKMLELGVSSTGATVFKLTPLVEGIENMQLEYGVDGDTTMLPASAPVDGYPDVYCTDPDNTCPTPNNLPAYSASNPTNWQNVMAVRINLLSRNTECTIGYQDTKLYTLGSLAAAASAAAPAVPCYNGDYKRHVFSELVRLVNPGGRRSQQ